MAFVIHSPLRPASRLKIVWGIWPNEKGCRSSSWLAGVVHVYALAKVKGTKKMKKPIVPGWQVAFGGVLVLLSVLFYALHFAIFRDAHHIWIYLLGDIAFVPAEVLVVTLIIHQLLSRREKKVMLNKLNMVIGVFFSETGNELLRRITGFSGNADAYCDILKPQGEWGAAQFRDALQRVSSIDPRMDCGKGDLKELQAYLREKRTCLMRLLENPNLLEHEAFTDVLWAVVHLMEELAARDLSEPLPDADATHLTGDMKRAHLRTVAAWLAYMQHLKGAYPYLYSLAVRQNPFDASASATVGA